MSDFVTGIETELSKGFQKLENVGATLLEDVENVVMHPITSLEKAGYATYDVLKRGAEYVERDVEKGAEYVESGLEKGAEDVIYYLPSHHTQKAEYPVKDTTIPTYDVPVVAPPVKKSSSRKTFKTIVNWTIMVLILFLIGVIIYLTCVRYSLAGSSLMHGDRTLAAALLTPELSAGLTTLAATL